MSELVKIFCEDGMAGWLNEVVLNPDTGQPTRLVIRPPHAECPEVMISTDLVSDIGEDEIRLSLTLEEFEVFCHNQSNKQLNSVEK